MYLGGSGRGEGKRYLVEGLDQGVWWASARGRWGRGEPRERSGEGGGGFWACIISLKTGGQCRRQAEGLGIRGGREAAWGPV